MLTGIFAARNIAGAAYDVWSVNTEQQYHEERRGAEMPTGRAVPSPVAQPASAPTLAAQLVEEAFARLDPVALGAGFAGAAALVLIFATTVLLLQGGARVGPTLGLLGNYLWGYSVTWTGAITGSLQAALGGFVLGSAVALLRNWGVNAYAWLLKRRSEAEAGRSLLDDV